MRCSSVLQLYDDYARGALSSAVLARIEEHLADCAACSREFELNEQIGHFLREGSEIAHPGGEYFEALGGKVLARLATAEEDPDAAALAGTSLAPAKRGPWFNPLWWTGGAAAAALLALGFAGEPDAGRNFSPFIVASAPLAGGTGFQPFDIASPEFPARRRGAEPTVILSPDSAKHELLLGPGIQASPLSANSMAEVASLPPGGLAGGSPGRGGDGAASARAEGKAKIQTVALKPAARPADTLQKDLAEQFELIRRQMTEGDDKALDRGLNDLEKKIDAQTALDGGLEALPSVRQVRLFADARDALRANRPREAWTLYRRILMADETTPLAYRASLQLADLYYNEWADFKEAQAYYAQAQGPGAEKAFTQTERDHIDRQLDRLRTHAGNQWESLALLHTVQRGDWPEVLAALRRLTALPGADDLLPETARSAAERLQAAAPGSQQGPPMETAIAVYKQIEARAATEANPEVRAWMEVALGDMQLSPFQEMQAAVNHYKLAIEAGGSSGAARTAAEKRDQLINRQLLDLVR